MKIEIDIAIPAGYRFVRYDYVHRGDRFITRPSVGYHSIWSGPTPSTCQYPIIEEEPAAEAENMEVVRRRYVFRNTFGRLLEVEIYNSRMGQVFSRQAGDISVMSLGDLNEQSCGALDMYCDKFPNHTLIACV